MVVRTFYWHERVLSRPQRMLYGLRNLRPDRYFHVGNAGDIFARDLIRHEYGLECRNIRKQGRRLLLVGSIAHRIRDGDVLCGIGTKGVNIPRPDSARVTILGLRGPITQEHFAKSGHDVSGVRFLMDPGLLIRFMVTNHAASPRGRVIFIPHYRERALHYGRLPSGLDLVDIDDFPLNVAKNILDASLVYTSSLHGIIFAHALRRPCVFVAPQTEEAQLKYQDYFASLDLTWRKPLADIHELDYRQAPDSPVELEYTPEDIPLPDSNVLMQNKLLD